jgi:Flp pilus assembly CpaF family ATPase
VLRGEAGIGKTALLEHLVGAASDLTVVRAVGLESDMELAVLVWSAVRAVARPARAAAGSAARRASDLFGLSAGRAPDRFLLGLAVLTLVSEAAEQRPLL